MRVEFIQFSRVKIRLLPPLPLSTAITAVLCIQSMKRGSRRNVQMNLFYSSQFRAYGEEEVEAKEGSKRAKDEMNDGGEK